MTGILFIVPSLRRAGAETQIIDLVNALEAENHEKHLLAFEKDLSQIRRIDQNSVVFHHILRRHKYDLGFVWKISELIDKHEIDIIHCTMEFALLIGYLARVRSVRKPALVVAIHTTIQRGIKQVLQDRLLYRWLIMACKAVVFVCKNQMLYWIGRNPGLAGFSTVIYNGIDVGKFDPARFKEAGMDFRTRYAIPENAFLMCCIAGFRPEKAQNLIVQVLAELPVDAWMVFAGDGVLRASVEAQVQAAGLADRVIFTGNLPDVRPLLAASNISLLASTAVETFSIAMLESMSMGVPMVASDIGGLSEAIKPGITGELFPPGDVGAMQRILMKTMHNRSILNQMGVRAREQVIRNFSVEAMANETELLLNSVFGRPEQ